MDLRSIIRVQIEKDRIERTLNNSDNNTIQIYTIINVLNDLSDRVIILEKEIKKNKINKNGKRKKNKN